MQIPNITVSLQARGCLSYSYHNAQKKVDYSTTSFRNKMYINQFKCPTPRKELIREVVADILNSWEYETLRSVLSVKILVKMYKQVSTIRSGLNNKSIGATSLFHYFDP
jgi:hypothetical protein